MLLWAPVTQLVSSFYGLHPAFCNMILDTAFSLLAAIFAFIILPAGDFIVGQEPPEAVRPSRLRNCSPMGAQLVGSLEPEAALQGL